MDKTAMLHSIAVLNKAAAEADGAAYDMEKSAAKLRADMDRALSYAAASKAEAASIRQAIQVLISGQA